VLQKATELFCKKGYNATGIQDLVEHLDINRASLYRAFGDKKSLYIKALNQYKKEGLSKMTAHFEAQKSIKEGFRSLLRNAILLPNCTKGCFTTNSTAELSPADPEILSTVQAHLQVVIGLFSNYLKKGQANKEIADNKDISSIATLFFTLYNGLNVIGKTESEKTILLASIDTAISILN
jgi:TetR/AcrR family transcriptional repressor of nem operon